MTTQRKPGRGGPREGAGRPVAADPMLPLGLRLPASLIARLDAVLDRGETRSGAGRSAIEALIDSRERAR